MLEALRAEVLEANLELVRRGLVLYTFGNASAVSREEGLIAIKPSGVPYDKMTPADMVIADLEGNIVEGTLRPSSDLPTHAALYRAFPQIGGVVHTHSRHATAWAQAGREIPCFGTTHADYFAGPVPVTADLYAPKRSNRDYELNTGLGDHPPDGRPRPAGISRNPGGGTCAILLGRNRGQSRAQCRGLEELAAMAWQTLTINPQAHPISESLHRKHHSTESTAQGLLRTGAISLRGARV